MIRLVLNIYLRVVVRIWKVDKYVDGTNDKAEVYLGIPQWFKDRDYETRAEFWD